MAELATSRGRRFTRPASDIYSTLWEVVALVDVPGVRKEDVEVVLEGDELVIHARAAGREEEESSLPWGYYRRFRLSPQVDRERVQAKLENGVLRIALGKVTPEGKRQVEVG